MTYQTVYTRQACLLPTAHFCSFIKTASFADSKRLPVHKDTRKKAYLYLNLEKFTVFFGGLSDSTLFVWSLQTRWKTKDDQQRKEHW